jgi:hypothetical protein
MHLERQRHRVDVRPGRVKRDDIVRPQRIAAPAQRDRQGRFPGSGDPAEGHDAARHPYGAGVQDFCPPGLQHDGQDGTTVCVADQR